MDASKNIIYGLRDPRTSDIRYIGRSSAGLGRPLRHGRPGPLSRETNRHKANWILHLLSVGLNYEIVVLESFVAAADLDDAECFWIAQAKALGWPLTNLTSGGGGNRGCSPTAEHRANISAAAMGHEVSAKTRELIARTKIGIPRSPETLAKMRAAIRPGLSAAHRAKISARHLGSKRPPETGARISAALKGLRKGVKLSAAHRKAIGDGLRGKIRGPYRKRK